MPMLVRRYPQARRGRLHPMSDEQSASRLIRLLPRVVAATPGVALCPGLAVWKRRSAGLVSSVALSAALGGLLSLGASQLAGAYWKKRRGSRDILFGDLMLWGWAR